MSTLRRNIVRVAVITAAILIIPLVAMLFTDEVNWTFGDFVAMGLLLFGSGAAFELAASRGNGLIFRGAVGLAVASGLLLTWINLAVGFIGSGANPANALYGAVIAVGLVGAVSARFEAAGLARTMFAMALVQFLIPVITLIFWKPLIATEEPGIAAMFMLNGFFVALFIVSGLLFRQASGKRETQATA
ncbi:MAG TPA: hypothetical protein VEY71_09020 [Chitinophagales bacterium]|nr:hypothetical protein [Chitinophagales bacterium]